ncbi:MAG: type VI secretion system protein TssA [Planctomycetota bacterium]
MASDPILDFDALMAPISDDAPNGPWLRETDRERYQEAKDARAEAVSSERKIREYAMYSEEELASLSEQGQGIDAPSSPDWRKVRDLCTDILANHSKDLWVATWLIEAHVRLTGYPGARDCFELVSRICETFWDQGIYPPHDEDDGYLDTVSQLASLNGVDGVGTLIDPLEQIALVPEYGALTYAGYREALAGGDGEVSEADFQSAISQIDTDELRSYGEDISQMLESFDRMCDLLAEKCRVEGEDDCTPPSSQIRGTLSDIQQAFTALTRHLLGGAEDDAEENSENDETGLTSSAKTVDIAQAQVNNREDAFRMLIKASEFFRKTEPHSPVSYMLQQAVEFGRMDLPSLLQKLIDDQSVLKGLSERVGLPLPDNDDDY